MTTGQLRTRLVPVEDLHLDPDNVRTHDEKNIAAIERSLELFGQRKPIVVRRVDEGLRVIAGNGTLTAARRLGWEKIAIAEVPADWTAAQAKAYAVADNRTAELADWDMAGLAVALQELQAAGIESSDVGFESADLVMPDDLDGDDGTGGGDYTTKVNVPQYDPVGPMPELEELRDELRADELRAEILSTEGLEPELQAFLLAAAGRHTRFNYRKIAEYYAHAEPQVQRLMERSALVIIDYEDAIRLGYVQLSKALDELRMQANANE